MCEQMIRYGKNSKYRENNLPEKKIGWPSHSKNCFSLYFSTASATAISDKSTDYKWVKKVHKYETSVTKRCCWI